MILALYILSAVVTALAWTLAFRKAEHRPVAVVLSVGLGSDLARRALRAAYLGRAIKRLGGDTPWPWPERGAGHLSDALFLAWPAALVGAALVVFLGRRPWPAIVGYAATVVTFVIVHPIAGNGSLGRMLTACMLIGLMVSIGCAVTWYLSASRVPTSTAQATLSLILAGELASVVGSWRIGVFDHWYISQIVYVIVYAVLALIQGGFLWQSRSGSP